MRVILSVIALLMLSQPLWAEDRFFPKGSLSSQTKAAEMMEDWFSKQLTAMGEKPLFPAAYGRTTYRLTYLPSFHNSMTFRLEVSSNGGGVLYATKNSGNGGYEPGLTNETRKIRLGALEVVKFQKQLSDSKFWSMSPFDESHYGLDGSRWIMEATTSGVHYFVMRHSPYESEFRTTMVDFMKLSGMDLGELY